MPRYQEMLDKVDWSKYGVVDGVARDPRCENCMVHCGYDPSGALGTNSSGVTPGRISNTISAPSPAPCAEGRKVKAFNGFSIGKGHLAEAKAANGASADAPKTMFHHNGNNGNGCGHRDTSQRDELLAKIQETKQAKA